MSNYLISKTTIDCLNWQEQINSILDDYVLRVMREIEILGFLGIIYFEGNAGFEIL